MMQRVINFLERYEFWLPIFLFFLFLLVSVPGISWGTPDLWHPDELIHRVLKALDGEWVFDEINFDYPSLPKYVMYGTGKIVRELGFHSDTIIIAARFLSAFLGALVVGFTYRITRLVGGGVLAAILAALLLITNSELVLNAHWAHNDLYVTFFVCLSIYGLDKYLLSQSRLWLYVSFFCAGLAASSKYNGGSIIIAIALIYLIDQRQIIFKNFLRIMETIFIGGILSVFGYAFGTPKSILWLAFYLKRLLPALRHHSIYGRGPESKIGLLTQGGALQSVWGTFFYIWIIIAVIYVLILLFRDFFSSRDLKPPRIALLAMFLVLVALDIPILLSYNVQRRFFLPMLPIFAIFASLFAQDMLSRVQAKGYRAIIFLTTGGLGLMIGYAFLRVLAISLLLVNDARIEASEYMHRLSHDNTIEYTLYPPSIPRENFSNAHNYPLVFIKYPDQVLPTSKHYEFNVGEVGIEERQPDYLVVDNFTVDRFEKSHICDLHQPDCNFFRHLKDGETAYKLIATFKYRLPNFLPKPQISFVNPDIYVYQRRTE